MSVKTGLCEYVWINATTTPFGLVTGGNLSFGEAPEHRTGVGGKDVLVGKMFVPTASIDFNPIGTDILSYAFRASTGFPCSSLTATTIGVGNGLEEKQLTGAKCNSLTITCGVDESLSATMEFMGTGYTATTYSKPTQTVGNHFEWYRGNVNIDGITTVRVKSYSISLENNLEAIASLKDPGANVRRMPEELVEGNQTVTLSITTHEPIDVATLGVLADDIVTDLTFAATMTKIGGSGTLTISMTNLASSGVEQPVEVDGVLEYSYEFETPYNNISVITIS